MAFDDTTLQEKYSLVKLSVHQSTQISSRTSAVLSNLQSTSEASGNKPAIVALTAKGKAASKLISIVEIAKRELAANGVKYFQYNALSSELVEIERKSKAEDAESGSDDAFETMGERELGSTKKRNVPVMTIYLAGSSVRELKAAFGEQT